MADNNGTGKGILQIAYAVVPALVVGAILGWVGSVRSGIDSVAELRIEVSVLKNEVRHVNEALAKYTRSVDDLTAMMRETQQRYDREARATRGR